MIMKMQLNDLRDTLFLTHAPVKKKKEKKKKKGAKANRRSQLVYFYILVRHN